MIELSLERLDALPASATYGVASAVAQPNVVGAVLFGSYARGDATSESDVDLLLVVADDAARREVLQTLDPLTHGISAVLLSVEAERDLDAGDDVDTDPLALRPGLRDPRHRVVVGQGDEGEPPRLRAADDLGRTEDPIRRGAVKVEVNQG